MSYVLHIWNQPRPASLEEAANVAFGRGSDIVGQEPAFLTLAKRLTQRYPCISTLPSDQGVWSDGPLDGKTDERALVLGIANDHEQVLAFVARTATELGLCVFDMQEVKAHLPGGIVLDADRPVHAAATSSSSEAVNGFTIREAVLAGLLRVLGEYGFTRQGSGERERLRVEFPGGRVEVEVHIIPDAPVYQVFLGMPIRLDHVVEIVHASRLEPRDRLDVAACHVIYFNEHDEIKKNYEIDSRDQLCAMVVDMCQQMAQIGIPTLAQCMDLRSFDRFLNSGIGLGRYRVSGFCLAYKVTIAKLAGNPDYEGIARRGLELLQAELPAAYHDTMVEIARLVDYLDTYDLANPPPPLLNPMDDLRSFVRGYDGSMVQYLCCIPSEPLASHPSDGNRRLRYGLMHVIKDIPLADYPDALVRDMFLAMAQSDRLKLGIEWDLWRVAAELMQRTTIDGLALVVENVALETLRDNLRQLPMDVAATVATRCHSRAADPRFAQHAAAYSAFGRRFEQRAVTPDPF